jgi:hypothetical protein
VSSYFTGITPICDPKIAMDRNNTNSFHQPHSYSTVGNLPPPTHNSLAGSSWTTSDYHASAVSWQSSSPMMNTQLPPPPPQSSSYASMGTNIPPNYNSSWRSPFGARGQFEDAPINLRSLPPATLNYDQTFLNPPMTHPTVPRTAPPPRPALLQSPLMLKPTQVRKKKKRSLTNEKGNNTVLNDHQDSELQSLASKFPHRCKDFLKFTKSLPKSSRLKVAPKVDDASCDICLVYQLKARCDKSCNRRASHRTLTKTEKERFIRFIEEGLIWWVERSKVGLKRWDEYNHQKLDVRNIQTNHKLTEDDKVQEEKDTTKRQNLKTAKEETSVQETRTNQVSPKSKSQKRLELLKAKLELAKQKKESLAQISSNSNNGVQAKLQAARERLQGALYKRNQALKNKKFVLTPISGLSACLIIKDIPNTGPDDMVYYSNENVSRKKLLLKKLEPKKSKQELQDQKRSLQTQMDISKMKHAVSRQEVLVKNIQQQIKENASALQQCQQDKIKCQQDQVSSQENIQNLQNRKRIIQDMISKSTQRLLQLRMKLHHQQQ